MPQKFVQVIVLKFVFLISGHMVATRARQRVLHVSHCSQALYTVFELLARIRE